MSILLCLAFSGLCAYSLGIFRILWPSPIVFPNFRHLSCLCKHEMHVCPLWPCTATGNRASMPSNYICLLTPDSAILLSRYPLPSRSPRPWCCEVQAVLFLFICFVCKPFAYDIYDNKILPTFMNFPNFAKSNKYFVWVSTT